jgi:hypothetical protein
MLLLFLLLLLLLLSRSLFCHVPILRQPSRRCTQPVAVASFYCIVALL